MHYLVAGSSSRHYARPCHHWVQAKQTRAYISLPTTYLPPPRPPPRSRARPVGAGLPRRAGGAVLFCFLVLGFWVGVRSVPPSPPMWYLDGVGATLLNAGSSTGFHGRALSIACLGWDLAIAVEGFRRWRQPGLAEEGPFILTVVSPLLGAVLLQSFR